LKSEGRVVFTDRAHDPDFFIRHHSGSFSCVPETPRMLLTSPCPHGSGLKHPLSPRFRPPAVGTPHKYRVLLLSPFPPPSPFPELLTVPSLRAAATAQGPRPKWTPTRRSRPPSSFLFFRRSPPLRVFFFPSIRGGFFNPEMARVGGVPKSSVPLSLSFSEPVTFLGHPPFPPASLRD